MQKLWGKIASGFFITCVLALSAPLASASVDGEWIFSAEVMGQSGNATVVMDEAEDGTITGTYSGQLGQAPIEGQREDDRFQFSFSGGQGEVTYEGMVNEDGTLEGTLDISGMADGTFTARKAE